MTNTTYVFLIVLGALFLIGAFCTCVIANKSFKINCLGILEDMQSYRTRELKKVTREEQLMIENENKADLRTKGAAD